MRSVLCFAEESDYFFLLLAHLCLIFIRQVVVTEEVHKPVNYEVLRFALFAVPDFRSLLFYFFFAKDYGADKDIPAVHLRKTVFGLQHNALYPV